MKIFKFFPNTQPNRILKPKVLISLFFTCFILYLSLLGWPWHLNNKNPGFDPYKTSLHHINYLNRSEASRYGGRQIIINTQINRVDGNRVIIPVTIYSCLYIRTLEEMLWGAPPGRRIPNGYFKRAILVEPGFPPRTLFTVGLPPPLEQWEDPTTYSSEKLDQLWEEALKVKGFPPKPAKSDHGYLPEKEETNLKNKLNHDLNNRWRPFKTPNVEKYAVTADGNHVAILSSNQQDLILTGFPPSHGIWDRRFSEWKIAFGKLSNRLSYSWPQYIGTFTFLDDGRLLAVIHPPGLATGIVLSETSPGGQWNVESCEGQALDCYAPWDNFRLGNALFLNFGAFGLSRVNLDQGRPDTNFPLRIREGIKAIIDRQKYKPWIQFQGKIWRDKLLFLLDDSFIFITDGQGNVVNHWPI